MWEKSPFLYIFNLINFNYYVKYCVKENKIVGFKIQSMAKLLTLALENDVFLTFYQDWRKRFSDTYFIKTKWQLVVFGGGFLDGCYAREISPIFYKRIKNHPTFRGWHSPSDFNLVIDFFEKFLVREQSLQIERCVQCPMDSES